MTYSTSSKTNEFGVSPVKSSKELGLIKICDDPSCEAIFHNCDASVKKCGDCGGSIRMINQETYFKKFSDNFFQYDQPSGEYYRPKMIQDQLELEF